MSLLSFLTIFILMTLLGGPLIMGWFIITRSSVYVNPDSTLRVTGMIFKRWSLFWEGAHDRVMWFSREETRLKFILLQKTRPDIAAKLTYNKLGHIWQDQWLSDNELIGMEDVLACHVDVRPDGLYLFVDDSQYTFPDWVRKPLSQCPPCMSSVYGSALYWFIILQVNGLFSWAAKENLAKFGFWIIFCLILACYSKFIQQKLRLDV